jgi:hypothetical protein
VDDGRDAPYAVRTVRGWQLRRSDYCPHLDLLFLTEETVDLGLQLCGTGSPPIYRRLPKFDKALDQKILQNKLSGAAVSVSIPKPFLRQNMIKLLKRCWRSHGSDVGVNVGDRCSMIFLVRVIASAEGV